MLQYLCFATSNKVDWGSFNNLSRDLFYIGFIVNDCISCFQFFLSKLKC